MNATIFEFSCNGQKYQVEYSRAESALEAWLCRNGRKFQRFLRISGEIENEFYPGDITLVTREALLIWSARF